jgi:DNA-binding HxlR family transcriptional regulator
MAPSRRSYDDSCGIARALDRVGERWALLVVRELVLGPKRFTDLRDGLPGCSPDVLSQRLRDLEGAGVVHRRRLPPPVSARVYELTEWGQELESVLLALGSWGSRSPLAADPPALNIDAAAIALKTTFDPDRAGVEPVAYQLRLGEQDFALRAGPQGLELSRGRPRSPAATLVTDPGTLTAVLWHGLPIGDAMASGSLTIEGSEAEGKRLLGMFPPPLPVAAGRG